MDQSASAVKLDVEAEFARFLREKGLSAQFQQSSSALALVRFDGHLLVANNSFWKLAGASSHEGHLRSMSQELDWKRLEACMELLADGTMTAFQIALTFVKTGKDLAPMMMSGATVNNRLGFPLFFTAYFQAAQDENASALSLPPRETALPEILPTCMFCKSIRDDTDIWHRLETFISAYTRTHFSHCVCPPCMQQLNACF